MTEEDPVQMLAAMLFSANFVTKPLDDNLGCECCSRCLAPHFCFLTSDAIDVLSAMDISATVSLLSSVSVPMFL